MESNKNKILAGIALIIVLVPLKLVIANQNIWFLISAILILIVIYFISNKPEFISSDKYYSSITIELHETSTENKEHD